MAVEGGDGRVPTPEEMAGLELRRHRRDRGWSQEEVARRMVNAGYTNWHQTTVGKTETGQRPLRLNEAVALAGMLGVPLTQLLAPLQVGPDDVAAEIDRTEAELAALNGQAAEQAEALQVALAAHSEAEMTFLATGEAIERAEAYLASLRAFRDAVAQPDADVTVLGYQQVLRAFRPAHRPTGREADR